MRYFKLYDPIHPQGDFYRLNGDVLEFQDDQDGEWYEQYSYGVDRDRYPTPESWFTQLLTAEYLMTGQAGSFEEVSAP